MLHHHEIAHPSVVGYLPVIPTSPTQLSTVFLLLQKSIATANLVNQESVVVVCDQALYPKATEIVWKHQAIFSRIALIMAAFHIALTFLAVIGKRFGDGGLHDVLVESGIVGPNAVSGVLLGKHYNRARALRCHKTILEALFRKNGVPLKAGFVRMTSLSTHC